MYRKVYMNDTTQYPSVIFTMGPSTVDLNILRDVLAQNISYVRFNMSHASHEEHRDRLARVRSISKELNKDIKVFLDLCGPKMRVTSMSSETLDVKRGGSIRIVYDKQSFKNYEQSIVTSYSELYAYVTSTTKIALDDGKILLAVSHVEEKDIVCDVVRGGLLLNEKGVNIIDTDLPINPFTEKDERDLLFGIELYFDAVALSFVKKKEDITNLRDFLKKYTKRNIPIIAKIETKQAVHNIEEILEVTDMIMVARGDLGIEIPVEKIPLIQKELAYVAGNRGVRSIVATEMLKSMTKNPFPTRAEITDCIDALIDGASFIMLSDETTIGDFPVEAVGVMSSVIKEFVDNRKKYTPFEKL